MSIPSRPRSGGHVVRAGGLLATVVLLFVAPLTGPAAVAAPADAAATSPRPAAGRVPGIASVGGGAVTPHLDVFYQQVDGRLELVSGTTHTDLGGALTSGPVTVTKAPTEFVEEWVFARGTDNAIWYRIFSDGLGEWLAWQKLGGQSLGAPGATCVGDGFGPVIVYARGLDGALWRKPVGGAWSSLGGALASDPSALSPYGGGCPTREDVFALGTDLAVWERVGGAWQRVGGRSAVAPAAVQLTGGETNLFVRGTDNALWMNTRPSGSTSWAGWQRIGGVLTSAPAATALRTAPQTRVVLVLGSDGNLWQARNRVGTSTWTWTQAP